MFKKKTADSAQEDPLINLIGQFGRWQCFVFVSISMVKLSFGWIQMAILFLTPNCTFQCVSLPNVDKESLKKNTCYKGCLKYEYDTTPFDNTIVSEWDLICERKWLASFTQTMLQLGVLIGSFMFGFLSDRFGRKPIFLVTVAMLIVIGVLIPFSPSYFVFTALRTLHGVAVAGAVIIAFVIIMECVGPQYREVVGCLYHIPSITGHASVSPIAYFFRSWDKYMLAMGLPLIAYAAYFFTVNESPRWLVSQGKVDKAIKLVTKACEINKRPTENVESTLVQLSKETYAKTVNKPKLNYSALLRKTLWVRTVCCCFMWLIIGMIFYGFNQYISQTSPDPFISVAMAGIIQIPSNVVAIYLIRKLGRRGTTSWFFIFCGIFVIAVYFVPQIFALTCTLATLGVSCVSIVTAAVYIYTSELFPTVVRNMGLGASSTIMRIGSMLAPFIANSVTEVEWLPTALFGISGVVAGFVCLILPETRGIYLSDNI